MIRSRLGLKALGLCALVVGVMSLSAAAAQAETGAKWNYNGAALAEALKPELAAVLEGEMGSLLTVLGGKSIHILCTALNLVGATIFNPNGQTLGKIDFKGCKFLELVVVGGTTKEIPACTPKGEGVSGLIVSQFIKGLIVLHEPSAGVKEGIVKFTPDTGILFTTIPLGEECAFGENLKVGGSVGLKDCATAACTASSFTTEKTSHLVVPVLQALVINEGATAATIDGSANVTLKAPHTLSWSGKPA